MGYRILALTHYSGKCVKILSLMGKVKVGVAGITGYAGMELGRLLLKHPDVELTSVTSRSAVGKKLGNVLPHLRDSKLEITAELGDVDIAFLALPHGESASEVIRLSNRGVKVIDLGADFRLKNAGDYNEWYGFTHPAPELLSEAVYGLSELYRKEIASAKLVANPGCYPTSALIALAPAVKAGLIGDSIIIDSKSGISGSGRAPSLSVHFSEVSEDVTAYGIEGHRHLPEIAQEIMKLGLKAKITFVPHLVPMVRGILSTCYAELVRPINKEEVKDLYSDFYRGEPFIRVVANSPHTKLTRGTNLCLVYPSVDPRTQRLIVVSALDNLVKGAAGQAVQNMNLILGITETTGLQEMVIYP